MIMVKHQTIPTLIRSVSPAPANIVTTIDVSTATVVTPIRPRQAWNYVCWWLRVMLELSSVCLSTIGTHVDLLRQCCLVLGKAGSSIQKLRADHPRTIIQVPDCASPERVLVISGENDQCFDALYQIIPMLTDSSRLSSFNRRRANANADSDQATTENQITGDVPSEIRLLIHQIFCGAIIGKGGQHVKELRQTHNLDIKVFSQCCPMSHERVISLRGKVEDIIECIKVSRGREDRGFILILFSSAHLFSHEYIISTAKRSTIDSIWST